MKHLIYLLLLVLVVSCKNESSYKTTDTNADYEVILESEEDKEFEIVSKAVELSEINNFEALSAQKLTEYFDLLKLKAQHPDFREDIIAQLKNYTNDSSIEFDFGDDFKIKNIKQIGEEQNVSDSVNKIQLKFDMVSKYIRLKDSVFATITSRTITVDGKEVKTNKVRFSSD